MSDAIDWGWFREAEKRNLLKPEEMEWFNSAKDRGLVPGLESQKPSLLQTIGKGASETAKNIGLVYPLAETALNFASQAYGIPASGLAMLAGLPFGKESEWGEAVQKGLVYQPQTQRGQQLTEATSYPLQKLGELGEGAATGTTELTGSPEMGTVVGTGIQALPLLASLRGGKPTGLSPEQIKIAQAVTKYKIPLSPKEYAPSAAASAFQIATDWFPTGRVIAGLRRRQIPEAIMKMREDFVAGLEGILEPTEQVRGRAQKGLETYIEEKKTIGKEGYKFKEEFKGKPGTWESVWGMDVKVPMNKTISFIESIKPNVPQNMRGFLNDFAVKKRGLEWNGEVIDLLQSQAYKKLTGYGNIYWDLMEKVRQDLQAYDVINNTKSAERLAQGKAAWRDMLTFEQNPLVKTYLGSDKWGGEPNMMKAFERATAEDSLKVKEIATPETWNLMKTNLIQDLVDKATIQGGEGFNNTFSPGIFADRFFKVESKIKKVYPESYEVWKDFAETMRVASRDMEKIGKGEGWWMGSALLGALTVAKPVFAIPAGFSAIVGNSLMNPTGWLRSWVVKHRGDLPGKIRVPPNVKKGIGLTLTGQTLQPEMQE